MDRMTYGIVGPIGHGKSSVAKRLRERHGFLVGSFAAPLKNLCLQVFQPLGAEKRHFFGTQEDKAEPITALDGVTGRRILELVGTDGFRAAYSPTWVRYALEHFYQADQRVVFEDVRFPNEAEAIRFAGGEIISVRALGKEVPDTGHESDQVWRTLEADHEIHVPAGAMEALELRVDVIVQQELARLAPDSHDLDAPSPR